MPHRVATVTQTLVMMPDSLDIQMLKKTINYNKRSKNLFINALIKTMCQWAAILDQEPKFLCCWWDGIR